MKSSEKLFCARCLTILGIVLILFLVVVIADSMSTLWLEDMERELATSLEVTSNALAGR
ncbi:hypothetical protein [Robiginitalea aurantiaca]|uniref:Uncharacterized protein n=1 Tax=Robiginitalea aurantiaca TaxID=3056915 RepID=A0ABT7WE18_9FLAO|nr:hypothetical protein [Robiginitalea aurantiaca]MDM9631161.1 hypothetical protein [Robiginitalea aurantiaca]